MKCQFDKLSFFKLSFDNMSRHIPGCSNTVTLNRILRLWAADRQWRYANSAHSSEDWPIATAWNSLRTRHKGVRALTKAM